MISIDGVDIKPPHNFGVESFNLTKSGRTANGRMNMDLIAKKKKLLLEYEVISGAEMQQILELIDSNKMFFTVRYLEHDGWKTLTCYCGAIPRTYFRRNLGWYYKDVKFSLIEQ